MALATGLVAVACQAEEEAPDAQAIVEAAVAAVTRPGVVFHAVNSYGGETWIDGERQLFRMQSGEEGTDTFSVRVGEGWKETFLVPAPIGGSVETRDVEADLPLEVRRLGPVPMWLEPLRTLVGAEDVRVAAEMERQGRQLIVLEATAPISSDDIPEGSTLVTRVELEWESYLPVAYEQQLIVPEEERREYEGEEIVERTEYVLTEFIPREDLPEGWFSPEVVQQAVVTVEEKMEQVRALGITPYWLGERFQGEADSLALGNVYVDGERAETLLQYALPSGAGGVRIILRLAGGRAFEPLALPPVGPKPEEEERVVVQERQATLYTSLLKPVAAPCALGNPCIYPDVPLYHRLVMTVDGTALQLEVLAAARTDLGIDENPFNNRESVLALAEALVPAE